MKIFIAGATGVMGRNLLPRLTEAGHKVTAITRSEKRVEQIRKAGATPVVCNVFDQDKLQQVVVDTRPEVVIHQLTNIPTRINPRKVEQVLAQTNRLRSEGTQILMDAAKAAGARRFIAQSISSYYTPTSTVPASEDEPLYKDAPSKFAGIVHAIDTLEHTVLNTPDINGIILRYGYFYGPGTSYAADGTFAEDVRQKQVPIIGNGGGVFSFVHIEDAANATILALNHSKPGIYNIVDNNPAPIREWLPVYADLLDAPHPMRLPKLIGRLAAGRFGVFFMTEQRGASNTKAKQELSWQPKYPDWCDGFRLELTSQSKPDFAQQRVTVGAKL